MWCIYIYINVYVNYTCTHHVHKGTNRARTRHKVDAASRSKGGGAGGGILFVEPSLVTVLGVLVEIGAARRLSGVVVYTYIHMCKWMYMYICVYMYNMYIVVWRTKKTSLLIVVVGVFFFKKNVSLVCSCWGFVFWHQCQPNFFFGCFSCWHCQHR